MIGNDWLMGPPVPGVDAPPPDVEKETKYLLSKGIAPASRRFWLYSSISPRQYREELERQGIEIPVE